MSVKTPNIPTDTEIRLLISCVLLKVSKYENIRNIRPVLIFTNSMLWIVQGWFCHWNTTIFLQILCLKSEFSYLLELYSHLLQIAFCKSTHCLLIQISIHCWYSWKWLGFLFKGKMLKITTITSIWSLCFCVCVWITQAKSLWFVPLWSQRTNVCFIKLEVFACACVRMPNETPKVVLQTQIPHSYGMLSRMNSQHSCTHTRIRWWQNAY